MDTTTLLKTMVEIYSPSGEEAELVDFLQPEMTSLGFRTSRDQVGNLVGRIGEGGTEVLLLGHLDTVEGMVPVGEENGNLQGRGTVDAKSALANFIGTSSQFAGSSDLEIIVIGVVEEETSSKGAYQISDTLSPDYVVIGEPSKWNGITLGYRGSVEVSYYLESPKTHRGEGSPLPSEEAVLFYRKLSDRFNPDSSGFNSTEVRLAEIRTQNDPFRDVVKMTLDVRTSTGFQWPEFDQFITSHKGQAKVNMSRHVPPVKSSKRNRLVSSFLTAIRNSGGEPKFKLKTGTSDMNILAENWEVPMIAYGPGDSSLDHTPNEHLNLEELSLAQEVLTKALSKLARLTTG